MKTWLNSCIGDILAYLETWYYHDMRIFAAPTRNKLIPAFTHQGNDVLEIGVGDSSFSRIILESSPEITLTAIDPFSDPEGEIPGFYDHDSNSKNVHILKQEFGDRYQFLDAASPDGLAHIPDGSFDWIFVDGDHLVNGVLADLHAAERLSRPGGVIACHDFAVHDKAVENLQEVVEATKIYLASNKDLTFYGIDLSVYPTSILVKGSANSTAIARLDELLQPWMLYTFDTPAPALENFSFHQTLTIEGDRFITQHIISCGEETARFETTSERIFSGYYNNISSRQL